MRDFWSKALTLVRKDVLSELRTKNVATSIFVFALLVIIVFNFAIETSAAQGAQIGSGVLWVAFAFAGVLGFNRSFILEKEKGSLDGLMLTPVDRSVIFVGKMLGNLIFMLVVEAIVMPIFVVLFNVPINWPEQIVINVLTTIGFASVGTLFSALSVNTKAREIMLPLLFLPVVVPILLAAVKSSAIALSGGTWGDFASWLQIMIAFDVIFTTVSYVVFEYVIEE